MAAQDFSSKLRSEGVISLVSFLLEELLRLVSDFSPLASKYVCLRFVLVFLFLGLRRTFELVKLETFGNRG